MIGTMSADSQRHPLACLRACKHQVIPVVKPWERLCDSATFSDVLRVENVRCLQSIFAVNADGGLYDQALWSLHP